MQKTNKKATHIKAKAGTRPVQKHKAISKTKKNPANARFTAKHKTNAKPIKKNTAATKKSMAVKSGKKNIKAKQQEKPKSKQTKHVVNSVPT
jgi:hypothetical protein